MRKAPRTTHTVKSTPKARKPGVARLQIQRLSAPEVQLSGEQLNLSFLGPKFHEPTKGLRQLERAEFDREVDL